jgi:hypothetical protein
MRMLTAVLLGVVASASPARADYVSLFDSFKCIEEVGLFEYNRLAIYNTASIPERFGYQPSYSAQFNCDLPGGVRVVVTGSAISIEKNGSAVFSGPKFLPLIRVFADPSSIDAVELCYWLSDLEDVVKFPRPGGCVYRGFPALVEDGPRTPGDVIKLIEQGDDDP